MADTLQGIRWTLAKECPLRRAEDWSNIALSQAGLCSRDADEPPSKFGLHDGICVTTTSGWSSDYAIPCNGFIPDEAFSQVGGIAGLEQLCGNCPANTALNGLAGCAGFFYFSPYARELDEELRILTARLDLEEAIERVFPRAELTWFRFWMNSPLSREALQILHPLLSEFIEQQPQNKRRSMSDGLPHFLRAMERALYFDLSLRVEMMPLGHTDFGWETTFAHCPRCKADAGIGFWTKVRHSWQTCQMCGHEFDPATTYSREAMKPARHPNLRELLGDERFRAFAIKRVLAQGATAEVAQAVVDKYMAPTDPAIIEKRRLRDEKSRAKRRFICAVLCAGLGKLKTDETDPKNTVSSSYLFTAEEAEILIARARHWGADVSSILHHSSDDDLDELWVSCRDFLTPEAALQNLRNQGCDEYFTVSVGISDEAFAAWQSQQTT